MVFDHGLSSLLCNLRLKTFMDFAACSAMALVEKKHLRKSSKYVTCNVKQVALYVSKSHICSYPIRKVTQCV